MGTKKIGAEIPDEVHRELAYERVDENETNDVIVTKALAEYFDVEVKDEWFENGGGDMKREE